MDSRSLFRNILMDTIRRLEWKSVFDTVHGYLFRYHKAGDDRVRPSAGSDNADIHAENSRAVIDTIYGNTVKWNQLLASGRLVDMGLPSGTLWATSNIDITQEDGFAASPFQYGCTMFSWGNVDGHNTPASGTTFDYNWGDINSAEPWYEGQVYGSTPGAALASNILANDTQDAARKNVGSLFKTPTNTQFQELIDNCIFIDANGDEIPSTTTNKLVTVNGVVGIYLKSNANGNRLFFSASGYGVGSSYNYRGASGYYWSSSFYSSRNAWFLYFISSKVYPQLNGSRHVGFAVRPVVTPSTTSEVGHDNHKFCLTSNYKNMIDLTAIEYPNIATVTPTVEEVEAWLALNGGAQDYYPYDKGSLISFGGTAIKSVGFNQWDEQWEAGAYNTTTGEEKVGKTLRNKNFIPVVSGKTYYFKAPATLTVLCYDANYGYDVQRASVVDNTLTIPDGVAFINFFGNAPYWQSHLTYNNDICINLSDSAKNGTYEPYREDVLTLDVTKIYGKVNGQGSYVQCYPNGMRSAGSVQDTLSVDEAVVKIGSVDLGTINFNLSTPENHVFRNTLSAINGGNVKPARSDNAPANAVSSIYTIKSWYGISSTDEMAFAISSASNNILTLVNQNYSTISSLQEAMSGVPLYYELATSITYTDLIYSEDGGVTGTPLSEFKYAVDKYSTEELIVPTSQTGAPTSTALNADIDYQYRG